MQRIVVTGGSGKLGRACVRDLLDHGYTVINADMAPPKEQLCPFVQLDLENLAQTMEVFSGRDWGHQRGVDAVVHLAAIPMPGVQPNETAFRTNTLSTYNVFEATRRLRIDNVVWASSETLLGLPFDIPPPYVPIDEECEARPETAYSLSKLMGERMAEQYCRWDPSRKIVGLRFSNVMEPDEYKQFPSFERDPGSRKFNLWGYIDARDGAQAVRKALLSDIKGSDVFIIANADTVMCRPNSELVSEFFPGVTLKSGTAANATLLSIEKAKRILGYEPQFTWRG
ncbi:NAD-dependent epimerase/dehydratase family protein [Paraburkholderia phenoliruptrix]|uniref:NAD-dependent epimerase/dehydratase family protein n=1 Tax=Paraburkholderia phenoliruptrix TaxID=252970 RepID=UPI0028698C9E|nr:NAD(P)-dependent oxidoreductase [Paraburkholderia phenoliruptrix]WMY11783.1 NAD(P)-dependent oxidoreductase [Paraburkholderia phenoliruptrix]